MARAEDRKPHISGKGALRKSGSVGQKSGTTGKGSSRGSKSPGNATGSKMVKSGGYGPLTQGKK